MNSQQIADQICADPTLRVVFVAATEDSARSFISEMARLLQKQLEVDSFDTYTLKVKGWDRRNPTILTVKFGDIPAGARIDLLVYEGGAFDYSGSPLASAYLSRLTDRGAIVYDFKRA